MKLIGTLNEVLNDLSIINQIAAAWWISQGYTVLNGEHGPELVGKNNATGEDDPQAARTLQWAVPQPVTFDIDEEGQIIPDAETLWWILSPTGDARFHLWRDYVPAGQALECEEIN